MTTLSLQNLCFSYGGKPILHNFSLSIPAGTRLAFMGASGLGKTTLLRLIAGLERPDSGKLEGLPKEGLSMVFQEDRLIPSLTVLENIRLTQKDLTRPQIMEMLDQLGLAEAADNLPASLSGGMSRRVSIARAMACSRELYLLDEPFKGLDPQTKQLTMDFVLKHTVGKTLIMVTHDLTEAEYMGMEIFEFPLSKQ